MKIIEGFEQARVELSKQARVGFWTPLTPELEPKEMSTIDEAEQQVRDIIDKVRSRKECDRDAVLLDYTLEFDGIELASLKVGKQQISSAYQEVDAKLVSALKLAAERIRSFYKTQKESILGSDVKPGSGWSIRPLNRVGVYAPGGTAYYPSTVLMTAIPAKVASVGEVILVTPPGARGAVPPPTLVAADIAGVDRVFSVGGAQAIAALAFGTESVPRVDKICGPGSIFVVLAKKMVYGAVDIDGLQGPSEVLIIADEKANPRYCAADLLAQAEHDRLASAVLVTTSRRLAGEVNREVERQLGDLPRQAIAAESLEKRGMIAVVANVDEAIELANLYAPEHLCLMVDKADSYVDKVSNAGCIFIGENSTVVLGDYMAGPSHVLPTGGTARFSSSLNITDFMKLTDLVTIDKVGLKQLGQAAATIARAEGLEAHARAVEERLEED